MSAEIVTVPSGDARLGAGSRWAAEDLGFWGIATIEHHFHSEGYEVAPSPGVINAWLGAHTKRINIGTNGYPLGTHDAIRVAEETAVLDHMLEGRYWAGFSRGYQSRWTDVLGQRYGAQATLSDGSAVDQKNRRVFEEQMDLVLKAWTQDSVEFDGEFSQTPYPYETGILGYPAADTAAKFGVPGEVDDQGAIRRISVTPGPYQLPHPPVFVASASSMASIQYCGANGFRRRPLLVPGQDGRVRPRVPGGRRSRWAPAATRSEPGSGSLAPRGEERLRLRPQAQRVRR